MSRTWPPTKIITAKASFIIPTKQKIVIRKKTSAPHITKTIKVMNLQWPATVQKYILTQRTENTVKKTDYDLNVWKRFFLEVGETREIEDIPADELNLLICRFIMEKKKKDGGAYEPGTLQSFQRSLQRYLNDKNSKINILKDQEFQKSREDLLSKKKQLVVEEAKGNRPHDVKELSNAEEDLLFCSGQFGDENPPTHSLVVIGTSFWIPCSRRKQKA